MGKKKRFFGIALAIMATALTGPAFGIDWGLFAYMGSSVGGFGAVLNGPGSLEHRIALDTYGWSTNWNENERYGIHTDKTFNIGVEYTILFPLDLAFIPADRERLTFAWGGTAAYGYYRSSDRLYYDIGGTRYEDRYLLRFNEIAVEALVEVGYAISDRLGFFTNIGLGYHYRFGRFTAETITTGDLSSDQDLTDHVWGFRSPYFGIVLDL